jgi:hypothetical protein
MIKLRKNSSIKDNESISSKNEKKIKNFCSKQIKQIENINSNSYRYSKILNKNTKEKIIIEETHENQINLFQNNTPTIRTDNFIEEKSQNQENNINIINIPNKSNKELIMKNHSAKKEQNEIFYNKENLINDKPDLIQVPKELKLMVLKKIISFIEKISKNLKPGVQIYTQKLLGLSMLPLIKLKFYEILKNENLDLSSVDQNIILLMGGELLNSSKNVNINPDLFQLKEFNESYLMNEMNSEAVEIFVKIFYNYLYRIFYVTI